MRQIFNLLIKSGIIALAAYLFPEYVTCANLKTLILAMLCMVVTGVVFGIVYMVVTIYIVTKDQIMAIISTIIFAISMGFIQLSSANHFVADFKIHGILTYIALVILFSIFTVSTEKG